MTNTDSNTDPRPVGVLVPGWTPPSVPKGDILTGRSVRLVALNADAHAASLHKANTGHDHIWDYLPYGPFEALTNFHAWIEETTANTAHFFYAIQDLTTEEFVGVASYLRIDPASGSIEVGNINYAPVLQRTVAATEAMYLMMKWAFDAGYRRYEWKCNALNAPSRRAAQRLGFSFEGVFRQATLVKGRNRDTAWFAAIDAEWPALDAAFQDWLSPDNFDGQGNQRQQLGDLTTPIRVSSDPSLAPR